MLDFRKVYRVDIHPKRRTLSDFTEIAVKAELVKNGLRTQLGYYNLERGHLIDGRVLKNKKDGIVFYAARLDWILTMHELTMDDFDKLVRPNIPDELSVALQDIDDVFFWYRREAGIT